MSDVVKPPSLVSVSLSIPPQTTLLISFDGGEQCEGMVSRVWSGEGERGRGVVGERKKLLLLRVL